MRAAILHALRKHGHDVAWIAEVGPRMEDAQVLASAVRDGRTLVTEDKDFGRFVHATTEPSVTVVLVRYPISLRREVGAAVLRVVEGLGERIVGAFVVVTPGRIRVRRRPAR